VFKDDRCFSPGDRRVERIPGASTISQRQAVAARPDLEANGLAGGAVLHHLQALLRVVTDLWLDWAVQER
jgi:hypothetical protein